MQDNFTDDIIKTLIKYMDGELNASEKEATERLLQSDKALQEQYLYLMAAKQAIKSQGIKQRVQAIHQQYLHDSNPEVKQEPPLKVIKSTSFVKTFMRIAAVFVLLMAGYAAIQYATTTNESLYQDNFIGYQLPVNRGEANTGSLDALYNAGNYNAVITAFSNTKQKTQKDYFLAAQAYMHLNKTEAAIESFQHVNAINQAGADKYFEQETDYYLALAYIKAGNIKAAENLLDKIAANKQHLFYSKARNISRTKLFMLKWKGK